MGSSGDGSSSQGQTSKAQLDANRKALVEAQVSGVDFDACYNALYIAMVSIKSCWFHLKMRFWKLRPVDHFKCFESSDQQWKVFSRMTSGKVSFTA